MEQTLMANVYEPSEHDVQAWDEWAYGRPQVIKDLALRFKPWKLYRLKTTDHRVTCLAFWEDGTVTVAVTGKYNLVSMERQVFGIKPDDLEECDLPPAGEMVGVYLSEGEQLLMINRRRAEHGLGPLKKDELAQMKADNAGLCVIGGEHEDDEIDKDVPPEAT